MPKKSPRRSSQDNKAACGSSSHLPPWHTRKPIWYERDSETSQDNDPESWRERWKEKIWNAAAPAASKTLPHISSSSSLRSPLAQDETLLDFDPRVQLPTLGILRHGNTPRTRVSEWPAADAELRVQRAQQEYDEMKRLREGKEGGGAGGAGVMETDGSTTNLFLDLSSVEAFGAEISNREGSAFRDRMHPATDRSTSSIVSTISSHRSASTVSSELRFLESRSLKQSKGSQHRNDYLKECERLKVLPLASTIAKDAENAMKNQNLPDENSSHDMKVDLRNFGIGNTAIAAFLRWMKKGNCKGKLLHLDLAANSLDCNKGYSITSELVDLFQCDDCSISNLDLSQNMIGAEIGTFTEGLIASSSSKTMTRLVLSNCDISDMGAKSFSGVLKQLPNLLHLDLSQNKIGDIGALNMAYSLGKTCGLKSLDLSWNNVHGNSEGGKSLSGCLQNNRNLTYLNLSCNPWKDVGLMNIAEAMKCNGEVALKELILANTKITSVGCILFSSSIMGNTRLQKLNVNGNPIGVLGARSLTRASLSSRSYLHVEDASGCDAGKLVIDNQKWMGLKVSKVGCNVEALIPNGSKDEDIEKYISKIVKNFPEGVYILDLSSPTELAVAVELVELARELSHQLKFEPTNILKLKKMTSKTSNKVEQDPWSINPWRKFPWPSYDDDPFIFPMNGVLQCEFKLPSINIAEVRDYPMTEMDQMISHSLGRDEDAGRWRSGMWDLTSKTSSPRYKHGRDDQEREQSTYCNSLVPWLTSTSDKLKLILSGLIDGIRLFSVDEVLNLMSLFDSKSHHLDIVVHAYPFIKDLSSISLILKLFSAREISRMQSLLGELFWFNPKRPMRRWKLNLANNLDRVLCKRLQDMCAYEKENRKSEGRPDTSEHGNHELWRNVRYQGKPLNYHSEWGIPFVGVVEFDVVTTRRPKLGSKAMKQQDFEIHCAEFRYFFEELLQRREIKLESLFATSALRPILQKVLTFKLSADQAVELCLCVQGKQLPTMSTYSSMSEMMDEEDAVLDEQVSQSLQLQAQARAEIMQRAFPAVIDLDNLWSCMCSKLTLQDCIEIASRIGLLNLWNPQQPEGHVELHLDKWDEHKVAEVVMDIAIKEHPEDRKQGKDVDAAKLVKNVGTWSFAYQVEDEHVRKDIRTQHAMEKFLISDVLKARGEA